MHILYTIIGATVFFAFVAFAVDIILQHLCRKCPRCLSRKVVETPNSSLDVTTYTCSKCGKMWIEDAQDEWPAA